MDVDDVDAIEQVLTELPLRDAPIFSAFLRDISERKRSERGIAKYAERLEVLHEIDRAIIAASRQAAYSTSACAVSQWSAPRRSRPNTRQAAFDCWW